MKNIILLITFGLVLTFFIQSCEDSPSSSNEYQNSLVLGKSVDYTSWKVLEVDTSFTHNSVIYFKVSSQDDIDSNGVRIDIDYKINSTYVYNKSFTYKNLQNYGHYLISSFLLDSVANYRATAIQITPNKKIATYEFSIK